MKSFASRLHRKLGCFFFFPALDRAKKVKKVLDKDAVMRYDNQVASREAQHIDN